MAKKDKKVDNASADEPMKRKDYEAELEKLHVELVKLQEWVKHAGLKVCVVFEGRDTAGALRFHEDGQAEGGLSGGFRPENLNHAPAGHAADSQGDIQCQRSGRNRRDIQPRVLPQPHDRALAELLFDLA